MHLASWTLGRETLLTGILSYSSQMGRPSFLKAPGEPLLEFSLKNPGHNDWHVWFPLLWCFSNGKRGESQQQTLLCERVNEGPERAVRGSGKRCVGLQKGVCEEVWETWSQHAFVISWLPSPVSPALAYLSPLRLQCWFPETLARKSGKVNELRPVPLAVWERHFVLTAQEMGVCAVLHWACSLIRRCKTVTVGSWGTTVRDMAARTGVSCLVTR